MTRISVLAGSVAAALVLTPAAASASPPTAHAAGEVVRSCPAEPRVQSGVTRVTGADRFAVSAAISSTTFTATGGIVFIASGETFPDALSGSAAAGWDGAPMLLVTRGTVSPEVASELRRLKPSKIIVLGGTDTVSTALEFSLEAYSPIVARLAGADRFAVSALIAAKTFYGPTKTAYVATGAGFADALSASAAAGAAGGPVLLTGKDSVPETTLAVLKQYSLGDGITVVGGPDSISGAVLEQLGRIAKTTRVAGADRFEVSAKTSERAFCADQSTVFVASGAVFPDALSGSAAAIANGAPVLLVGSDSIPAPIDAELRRLRPVRIVVLGGPDTISDRMISQLDAYLRP